MCGSSSPAAPTSSTTNTSNIPEYARPYVETMLGATQKQLFDTKQVGGEYDPNTGTTSPTTTEITGMKPYTPFSTNMNDYFAGFSPMQQQSFQGAANLGPTQQNADASNMAGYAGLKALSTNYDPMQVSAQQFGTPQAAQYMSPYLEAAMAPQLREAERASQMQGQKNAAQAVGQGAYGGSRSALVEAERQRNLGMQQGDIRAKGYQDAFTNAQAQFNADQARAMQAQTANVGQQQFGANLGMQGLSTGLNAANQLGTLGAQQFGQEKEAIGLQNQLGTQQQQLEQQKINQQIQNYANQQQWGMQQLSNMNAMLRGLPLQTTTTQTYQAAPSTASQVIGAGTALAGIAGKTAKSGGSVKNIKKRPDAGLAAGALNKVMKG